MPYLLNPAGIVALVIMSAEADSIPVVAMFIGILALVLLIDVAVFRWETGPAITSTRTTCW